MVSLHPSGTVSFVSLPISCFYKLLRGRLAFLSSPAVARCTHRKRPISICGFKHHWRQRRAVSAAPHFEEGSAPVAQRLNKACNAFSEKAMAPHSSTLAWKIPWMEEPGGLQSMWSLRVGHDWATSLWLFTFMHWRRKWQPAPVFLPGESQG